MISFVVCIEKKCTKSSTNKTQEVIQFSPATPKQTWPTVTPLPTREKSSQAIFFKLKKLTNQNIVASYEAGKNLDCTATKLLLMTKIHHAAPSQIFDHS